jgi:hypothetical protein
MRMKKLALVSAVRQSREDFSRFMLFFSAIPFL